MIQTGTQAPNFSLPNAKKEAVSLESFRGKTVVLAFFPGAFTGVCTKEMCTFRDSLAMLNGLNATVIGIAPDSPFSLGAFAEKNQLTFPLLSDFNRATIKAYDLVLENFAGLQGYTSSKRAVFVINAAGQITHAQETANPGVEPDYDAVRNAVEAAK